MTTPITAGEVTSAYTPEATEMPTAVDTILDFYRLPGADNLGEEQYFGSLEAHTEIAEKLGEQLDTAFIQDVLMPRLHETDTKIHLVIPLAMRAATSLVNTDLQKNPLIALQAEMPERLRITYLPIGITRHPYADRPEHIEVHTYFPNGTTGSMSGLVDFRKGEQVITRIVDFGIASGKSLEAMSLKLQTQLRLNPNEMFIDSVIATDEGLETIANTGIPRGNLRSMAVGIPNAQKWIVGLKDANGRDSMFSELGLGPKDWGDVTMGMVSTKRISIGSEAHQRLFWLSLDRFNDRLLVIARLNARNNDAPLLSHLNIHGLDTLRIWYSRRYLGQAI